LLERAAEIGRRGIRVGLYAVAKILSGAEPSTRAGDQQGATPVAGLDAIQRLAQLPMHGFIESIEFFRAIEDHARMSGFFFDQNRSCHSEFL